MNGHSNCDKSSTELLHVDVFAGRGGWQSSTKPDPSWRSVGIDIRPLPGTDVIGDVKHLPIDTRPDLLTMSPPCTEFARWMMPWLDEPDPDMSLVKAALDIVDELNPRYWVLENSRGLHQYWRPSKTHIGPFYLWGEWPPIDVDSSEIKRKMQTSGSSPNRRAEIPHVLSKAMKHAVENYGRVVRRGRTPESQYAHYECDCGSSIKFHPDEFDRLRWVTRKFGYKNPSDAIADIRDCCSRPEYMELNGFLGGEQADV